MEDRGDKAGFVLLVTVNRGEWRGRWEIFFFVVNESRNAETITVGFPGVSLTVAFKHD